MELTPLVPELELAETDVDGLTVHRGTLDGREVVAIVTGMGTELAAAGIERLLDAVDVDHVLVVGITGALEDETPIGTLVRPEVVVLGASGREHRPTRIGDTEHEGRMWTTDTLTTDLDELAELRAQGVVALDMETAAIAHACEQRGIPWSVFRAISRPRQQRHRRRRGVRHEQPGRHPERGGDHRLPREVPGAHPDARPDGRGLDPRHRTGGSSGDRGRPHALTPPDFLSHVRHTRSRLERRDLCREPAEVGSPRDCRARPRPVVHAVLPNRREVGTTMIKGLFFAVVIFLVGTFPATWLLMLFLGNVHANVSYWGALPLGALVSVLLGGLTAKFE